MRMYLSLAVALVATCSPAPAFACTPQPSLVAAAAALDKDRVGYPRAVVRAIAGAVAATCHDSKMVGDHYWPATWVLGSCELDAIALLVLAWEEGRFCLGSGPACPRGDHGHSVGTFQVSGWVAGEWNAELTDLYERDIDAAARAAYASLRTGATACPDEPLAPYCGGCHPDYSRPHATDSRAMAHAREARARALFDAVVNPEAP